MLPARLARFNKAVTNRISGPAAQRIPGFAVVVHRGRVSGETFETPVNVFVRPDGFVFALTYGRADWVRNVLAAGAATVKTRGRSHAVAHPRIVADPARSVAPRPVRAVLGVLGVREFLWVDEVRPEPGDGK